MIDPRMQPLFFGHEDLEQELLHAWKTQRLPHSLILLGPKGIGKATFAYRLARFLLASSSLPSSPASFDVGTAHPTFRRIAAGAHGDLMVVASDGEITIENIRTAIRFLSHTPQEGGWRVVIIDGIPNRNAANALLKVLEEPPEKSLLLIIAEASGRLPATLLSRCHRLAFAPLPLSKVAQFVKEHYPCLSEQEIQTITSLSEGCPGRAVNLQEGNGGSLYKELLEVLVSLPSSAGASTLLAFCQRIAAKATAEVPVDPFILIQHLLSQWICKLIWASAGSTFPPEVPLPTSQEMQAIRTLAPFHTLEEWTEIWESIHQTFKQAQNFHLDRFQSLLYIFNRIASLERQH